MTLTPHFISGYVYLTDETKPAHNDIVCNPAKEGRAHVADESCLNAGCKKIIATDHSVLDNLTPEDAAYCKGKESVEIEEKLPPGSAPIYTHSEKYMQDYKISKIELKDGKVIVKREEVKEQMFTLKQMKECFVAGYDLGYGYSDAKDFDEYLKTIKK